MSKSLRNFIGGEWVETTQWLDNTNPATNEFICKIPRSDKADVLQAVQCAKRAFNKWQNSTVNERVKLLNNIAKKIEENSEELALLETQDTGKPITLSQTLDIPRAAENFRFFATQLQQGFSETSNTENSMNYSHRSPLGVAGLITPWNLPLYLLSWKVAPALAAGNCVVCKPSELTPQTANALANIFLELNAPPGIFNVVHGLGDEAGQALVEDKDVAVISFTGGTKTGKEVAKVAAPMFKKISLELGGKNPAVVFADCDFNATVKGIARACFLNQGQICLCASRIYIDKTIYDKFKNALLKEIESWKLGDPMDAKTKLGALISAEHLTKVSNFVNKAKELGGKILTGGQPLDLPGAFYKPTIIEGLSNKSVIAQEEIFGPVVLLFSFESKDEALQMANDTKYGLSASVWTKNLDLAHNFSQKLQAGVVWVNTWLLRDLRTPFGGMKQSGVGREGGDRSLEFFSETKNICIKLNTLNEEVSK